jgi:phytoene synthase
MSELRCPSRVDRSTLAQALLLCEEIAAKDRSNLYRVSLLFEDRARYDAFIAMYALMRVIDDRVDSFPDKYALSEASRRLLLAELDAYEEQIESAYRGDPCSPLSTALCAAIETFPVPASLWSLFLRAMRFDVTSPRFVDYPEFLSYSEGATCAPTSIYLYLLASTRDERNVYRCTFDFEQCGRDLGLFAYLCHILRDFVRDLSVGERGLVYVSQADLLAHDLSESCLREMVARGEADDRFCRLVRALCQRAAVYQKRGTATALAQRPFLDADCAVILTLIISMYSTLLERIEEDPTRILRGGCSLSDEDHTRLMAEAREWAESL